MLLILTVAIVSILVGYGVGGRLRNFEGLRLRWWGLAPIGLAMQLVPIGGKGDAAHLAAVGLLIASYALLLVFCLANLRLPGFPLIAAGLLLNLTVISLNGGMPVSRGALKASDQGELLRDLVEHGGAKHHLAGPGDVLTQLADVIPIPSPVHQVVSAGDLVVYAGVVWFVAGVMRRRPRDRARPHLQPSSSRGWRPPPPGATPGASEP